MCGCLMVECKESLVHAMHADFDHLWDFAGRLLWFGSCNCRTSLLLDFRRSCQRGAKGSRVQDRIGHAEAGSEHSTAFLSRTLRLQ